MPRTRREDKKKHKAQEIASSEDESAVDMAVANVNKQAPKQKLNKRLKPQPSGKANTSKRGAKKGKTTNKVVEESDECDQSQQSTDQNSQSESHNSDVRSRFIEDNRVVEMGVSSAASIDTSSQEESDEEKALSDDEIIFKAGSDYELSDGEISDEGTKVNQVEYK